MAMPNTIIWGIDPIIMQIGPFTLRWYSLFFAISFMMSILILQYMFKRAGKRREEAEKLQIYLTFGVIFGARLGHVIFYEWASYQDHLWQIFLPIAFHPTFRIIGFSGLASHGAGIGMLIAIFLYVKRIKMTRSPFRIYLQPRKPKGTFLWILDHLVILLALSGMFVRIGNFMNSEIIGKPTHHRYGVVFVKHLQDDLSTKYATIIDQISICKATNASSQMLIKEDYQPIQLTISFQKKITDESAITNFLNGSFKNRLVRLSNDEEPMIYEGYNTPLSYSISTEKTHNGNYQAIVHTLGIPRHPAQLYEAFSCFVIFIILFGWWYKKSPKIAAGRLFGTFMIVVFSLRFIYEFYKENQVAFENNMPLNMGQLLSLPCIIIGLWFMRSTATKTKNIDSKNI